MTLETRERFFFGESAAGMYDRTIDLVVPHYRLMHQTAIRHLKNHLIGSCYRNERSRQPVVLDVGAGTGEDTIAILRECPLVRVVAIDLCEPMCKALRSKLESSDARVGDAERCRIVHGDILGESGEPLRLKELLPDDARIDGYDAVVTALTVHHFTPDEKRLFFERMFDSLRNGGVIIIADLFSFASKCIAEAELEFDLSWIRRQFETPDPQFAEAREITYEERKRLCRLWINHYLNHNRLDVLEGAFGVSPGDGGTVEMLRQIGFCEVTVLFRHSLSAVVWARK